MPTKFSITRDINGYNGFGLKPSDTNVNTTLTANTDTTYTIPGNTAIGGCNVATTQNPTMLAIFYYTPGTEVWVAVNATANVPAGATFAATSSEGNPAAWEVKGGDVIHCKTAATGVSVGIRLYWLT